MVVSLTYSQGQEFKQVAALKLTQSATKTPKPEISIGPQLTSWLEGLVSEANFGSVKTYIIPTE